MAQITLFTCGKTPNPHKVRIFLEELGIKYECVEKELNDGPNGIKHPSFTKINPNGRLPAIIDHSNEDFAVWESGAILFYLAERFDSTGKYIGGDLREKTEVLEWVAFQISGVGPTQGNVSWFQRFHPVKNLDQSVYDRYTNETKRLYGVLEKHLAGTGRKYIALDRLTIADVSLYPWLSRAATIGIDMAEFPNLKAYVEGLAGLPSVQAVAARPG